MKPTVYVNGRITAAHEAVVPVFDHGFLYGEGVYETMRTYQGRPFMFPRHMARLRRSAGLLGIAVPDDDEGLRAHVNETMAAARDSSPAEAYIRLLLTRGVGELTYQPSACPTPSLIIIVKALPVAPDRWFTEGITVSLVSVRRNHPDALNPLIKSNNLLNNAMAMQEALRSGADEALMRNQDGDIVECSQSNFFIVKDGTVRTAPLSAGLLPGITRGWVLELAAEIGIAAVEERITPGDVIAADEAFITGTTRDITPVVAVDASRIGTGVPGPVTARLLTHFRRRALDFI
jgi:branched-chain amino acid aminotransferase